MTTALGRIVERLRREDLLQGEPPTSAVEISDVTTDSRTAGEGTLFCAIRGTSGDGHGYLEQVEAAGAAAALVEEPARGVALPQVRVRDGRRAAAVAAAEHFGDPWNEMILVGITGTNGKTTSAAILRHLLATDGGAASIGTLGAVGADGAVIPGTEGLTTPGPVEVARWLRRLRDDRVSAVAMEVSSHALHQARVGAVRFDAALFTNLSRDHLDYHATLEEYREAKLRLRDLVKEGGAVVLNADDPAWRGVEAPDGRRTVRFSVEGGEAEVGAEGLRVGARGIEFTLRTPDGDAEVALPLYGTYNVANAVGCAAVLWALGRSPASIADGLTELPQVPGRLERVPLPDGFPAVLIDYAHTPDALERALAALRPLVRGDLVVVFGAGGDRDRGKRPEMGRVATEGADRVIVTSDNPRTEDPERIADEVEAGMGDAARERIVDRRAAIRRALESCGEGDVVLLAGKGHETYQISGTEKLDFDERRVIRDLLEEMGERR